MKKIMRRMLAVLMVLSATVGAHAYSFTVGGIYYNITDAANRTVGVTYGDVKYKGDIALPSSVSYNGVSYRVRSIEYRAFYGCNDLTSITLGEVKTIGIEAFSECSSLQQVSLLNIESIENSAFYGCTALTKVSFGGSLQTIGSSAFSGCSVLKTVSIPSCVISLGSNAFSYDNALKTVTIGNGLKEIPSSSFSQCVNLETVVLGDKVESIAYRAFYGCTSLTDINLDDNIENFGNEAFSECTSLKNVILGSNLLEMGTSVFADCTNLTSVTIHDGAFVIGSSAFYGCTKLRTIDIPHSVMTLGNSAFAYCTALTAAKIGDGINEIGGSCFNGCTRLQTVTIGSGVQDVDYNAFNGCNQLKNITIFNSDVPATGANPFSNYNATLTVPSQSVNAYKVADTWKKFSKIQPYTTPVYLSIKQATGGCVKHVVEVGAPYTYTIVPDAGWHIYSVTFNDVDVTKQLVDNTYTTPDMTADGIIKINFAEGSTGINSAKEDKMRISVNGESIVVNDATAGEMVYVYTSNGLLESVTPVKGNQVRIRTKSQGVYVVKIGDRAIKVCM